MHTGAAKDRGEDFGGFELRKVLVIGNSDAPPLEKLTAEIDDGSVVELTAMDQGPVVRSPAAKVVRDRDTVNLASTGGTISILMTVREHNLGETYDPSARDSDTLDRVLQVQLALVCGAVYR